LNSSFPDGSCRISVPEAERLAVDLERSLASLVLDPEVLTDREHLLGHLALRPTGITIASE
jgi:hypothetical protein